jgi:ornithine decarboxylase
LTPLPFPPGLASPRARRPPATGPAGARSHRPDSVYHTFSGIIFDHCQYPLKAFKRGKPELCAVFGQTCDGLDCISQSELLPELEIEDLVYAENIGAYSNASATWFNGFPPAKVIHVNE